MRRKPRVVIARVALLRASLSASLCLVSHALTAQSSPSAAPFVVPAWAFPTAPPAPKGTPPVVADSVTLHRVPNSARQYTMKQVGNAFDIPDRFPRQHPAMPAPVQYGVRPDGRACGFCHLPDGQGRPENGTLAGLPVEYTVRQVWAMRDGTRGHANPAGTSNPMISVAKGFTDDEVRTAARYYARLKLTRRNIVCEVTDVPTTRIAGLLYALDGTGTEPIAGRLIEAPESIERHELRDPWVRYTTYVPVGSLARGRRLTTPGPVGASTNCATCHGPQLLGVGEVPPIAGRSPSNLLRQLINFRTRARRDSTAAPMYAVVDSLSIDDMVALAAYVGSLPPSRSPRK
ncbi:c-type cytochrome [Gemmatimonas sp.]|uniref:c-type cytochrome n=1 Tax=Gemmatimonas sp. TaxID=1962908 RepID=UPI003DA21575